MTKTNKSFLKRLRVTKRGKVLSRAPGHCHFKAKQKRSKQLSAKRPNIFDINKKTLGKYLSINSCETTKSMRILRKILHHSHTVFA